MPARSPTAPSDTPRARCACVVIDANESHRSWVQPASRQYPASTAHRLTRAGARLSVATSRSVVDPERPLLAGTAATSDNPGLAAQLQVGLRVPPGLPPRQGSKVL